MRRRNYTIRMSKLVFPAYRRSALPPVAGPARSLRKAQVLEKMNLCGYLLMAHQDIFQYPYSPNTNRRKVHTTLFPRHIQV